jgi:hypothetical protein
VPQASFDSTPKAFGPTCKSAIRIGANVMIVGVGAFFSWIIEFMNSSFLFPARVNFENAGPEEAKNLAGQWTLRLIQIRLLGANVAKISLLPR